MRKPSHKLFGPLQDAGGPIATLAGIDSKGSDRVHGQSFPHGTPRHPGTLILRLARRKLLRHGGLREVTDIASETVGALYVRSPTEPDVAHYSLRNVIYDVPIGLKLNGDTLTYEDHDNPNMTCRTGTSTRQR